MTSEDMAARIQAAAAQARRDDRTTLAEAKRLQADVLTDLTALVRTAYTIREQKHRLWWSDGIGFILGCLLGAVFPGLVGRMAPTSWHWPERIAMRAVREAALWDAGARIMRAGNPDAWVEIVSAVDLREGNDAVIAACEKAARTARRSVRCTIEISLPDRAEP